jgi:hypothetical protein
VRPYCAGGRSREGRAEEFLKENLVCAMHNEQFSGCNVGHLLKEKKYGKRK